MDITRFNFESVYPDVEELIKTCDCFAIDLEMTGITIPGEPECSTLSPQALYNIKRKAAMKYNILQVGVALFHKKRHVEGVSLQNGPVLYECRPFNFFVFPHATGSASADERQAADITMSPDAIAFLRRHNLDFQEWLYRGVPYLNKKDTELAAAALENELNKETTAEKVNEMMALLTEKEQKWVKDSLTVAKKMMKEKAQHIMKGVDEVDVHNSELHEQNGKGTNGREAQKRIVTRHFQRIEELLPSIKSTAACKVLKEYIELDPKLRECITVNTRGRWREKDAILNISSRQKRHALARQRLSVDQVGFRRVFEALSASGKPCVGHHCFVDHLFLSAAFDNSELPHSLEDFKTVLHQTFPITYDTKFLSSCVPPSIIPLERFAEKGTGLSALYSATVDTDPELVPPHIELRFPLGFHAYHPSTLRNSEKAHEAGYDAMMTGAVFLHLQHEYGHKGLLEYGKNKMSFFNSLYAADMNVRGADKTQCIAEQKNDHFIPQAFGGDVLLVDHNFDSTILLENYFTRQLNTPVVNILRTTPSVAGTQALAKEAAKEATKKLVGDAEQMPVVDTELGAVQEVDRPFRALVVLRQDQDESNTGYSGAWKGRSAKEVLDIIRCKAIAAAEKSPNAVDLDTAQARFHLKADIFTPPHLFEQRRHFASLSFFSSSRLILRKKKYFPRFLRRK